MMTRLAASVFMAGALLLPMAGYAADYERSSPAAFVRDSLITARVKAGLAANRLSSLLRIKVRTDDRGVVTLGGTARNRDAADKAVLIAQAVTNVNSVDNRIKISTRR